MATVDTEATKQAILSYAAQYSDSLPEDLIPDQLQTVLAAVDGDQVFEALELPTEILAPASGTITSLSLHQGELFLPQTAAATISYMGLLTITAFCSGKRYQSDLTWATDTIHGYRH